MGMHFGRLYLILLFLLLKTALFFGCSDGPVRKGQTVSNAVSPNIIFIFADNLGYGDIEPFGAQTIRTPNLNRMAAEGRKFTHFCSTAGVCTPSRASAGILVTKSIE